MTYLNDGRYGRPQVFNHSYLALRYRCGICRNRTHSRCGGGHFTVPLPGSDLVLYSGPAPNFEGNPLVNGNSNTDRSFNTDTSWATTRDRMDRQ